jgi:hypothetical protein
VGRDMERYGEMWGDIAPRGKFNEMPHKIIENKN